ncbi:MAG: hypothetical protein HY277_05570, partial [Ignavibacteriales bacterium]|nr:hypothetical protein [Ignavibacteriales bacterium]
VEVNDPVQRYFPLAVGNTWDFYLTTNLGGGDTTSPYHVALDSPFVLHGIKWYAVENVCLDARILSPIPLVCGLWARSGNKILAQREGPGPTMDAPEVMLDFPLSNGKQWTIYNVDTTYVQEPGDTVRMIRLSKRYVRGFEIVTVPAGAFINAVHVGDSTWYIYTNTHSPRSVSESTVTATDEWYAIDVGMVKQFIKYTSKSSDTSEYSRHWMYELRKFNIRLSD